MSGALLNWGAALVAAQNTTANEGGDLSFGGPGSEAGKFLELRDMIFDARGTLYTLDGVRINDKTKESVGNLRVQKFDKTGKLLGTIDLRDAATGQTLGDKNNPHRIAADANGNVYITQPVTGQVQQFSADGKFVRAYDLPRASAITTVQTGGQERIAVVPSRREVVGGKWTWLDGDKIVILGANGAIESTIALDKKLENVMDVTADREGNFYIQAEPNAIYKFSPTGKWIKTFGGNPTTRNEDGSEVLHTVAVDTKGNVYTFTWGNPGKVTRFDADGKSVTQRDGQFKWADPWSIHSSYAILALDPEDRLWAGVTNRYAPDYVHLKTQRAVPAIVRTKADYFATPANAVRQTPLRMLGFKPDLRSTLPNNIAYEPKVAAPMEFSVGAANRFVQGVTVDWHAFDAFKNEVAKGRFDVPLTNGEAAKASFNFVPPRFGHYFVQTRILSGTEGMGALGEHIGVTPRYANMPVLAEGESKGGWEDAARHAWTGLPNMRLHPGKSMDKLDEDLANTAKYGNTVLVQIVDDLKKFKPEETRAIMERFKGRIKYIEVCNEPNFSGSIEDYFKVHKQVYEIVKAVDPQVQIMGPATVNIDLNWIKRLYELGFKDVSDIIALHDYEGHESISPEHWAWKFGEVRKIMAQYGDANKPIWQTERAISGVRGNNYQGTVQAIRTTLHRDLLETLNIPTEHNNHYYLNQGGYSDVPTYVWSSNGPMPAALALRTRHGLTAAQNRRYAGKLDFGPSGNELFMGVRYGGADGETVSLRNLGTRTLPLEFDVQGAPAMEVIDAWGNAQPVRVQGGKAQLTLEQMPIYVRLPRGATLTAPKMDFGANLAQRARFNYSSTFKGDFGLLNTQLSPKLGST